MNLKFKNKNGLYRMDCMGLEDPFPPRILYPKLSKGSILTPNMGVRDGIGSSTAAYDPATDDSIVYWFKSDWSGACLDAGSAQCDDGEECATWVASKGGANAAYLSSIGPLFQTNYQNSLGVLEGVANDQAALRTAEQASISQPFTFWMVFKHPDLTRTHPIVASYDATPQVAVLYLVGDTSIRAAAPTSQILFTHSDSNMHILRVTFNGASSTYQLDGGSSTAFPATPGDNGYVGVTLFNLGTQDYYGGAAIAEVLIQNKAPSAGEDTSIRGYLNTKWAVY